MHNCLRTIVLLGTKTESCSKVCDQLIELISNFQFLLLKNKSQCHPKLILLVFPHD